jgi:hypothetical protein
MEQDRELFRFDSPDFLPEFGVSIVQSSIRKRWTLLCYLHTRYHKVFTPTDELHLTYTFWLQLRLWWPPVLLKVGWVNWNK